LLSLLALSRRQRRRHARASVEHLLAHEVAEASRPVALVVGLRLLGHGLIVRLSRTVVARATDPT
jgi:hypothetical protein